MLDQSAGQHNALAVCMASSVSALTGLPIVAHGERLVSFTFNLGAGALPRSTLRRRANRGEHEAAAGEFKKWIWAAGKRLPGLVVRRRAESALYGT